MGYIPQEVKLPPGKSVCLSFYPTIHPSIYSSISSSPVFFWIFPVEPFSHLMNLAMDNKSWSLCGSYMVEISTSRSLEMDLNLWDCPCLTILSSFPNFGSIYNVTKKQGLFFIQTSWISDFFLLLHYRQLISWLYMHTKENSMSIIFLFEPFSL